MPPRHDMGSGAVAVAFQRLNSTVLPEILPQVALFTLITFAIAYGSNQTGAKIEVNTVMLGVLTTMLSFSVSLRVSSASERYTEGRKAWSSITLNSRNLALLIWIHAPSTTLNVTGLKDLSPAQLELEELKGLVEKRTVLNLVEAFSVATKHYLRGEHGPCTFLHVIFFSKLVLTYLSWILDWTDLYHLISALPKYSFQSSAVGDEHSCLLGLWRTPAGPDGKIMVPAGSIHHRGRTGSETLAPSPNELSPTPMESAADASAPGYFDLEKGGEHTIIELAPAWNPPPRTMYHYIPLLIIFRPIIRLFTHHKSKHANRRRKSEGRGVNAHVPLEILLFLNTYIHQLIRRGTMEAPLYGVFLAATTSMQDCVTTLERILTTPLPFAYSAHLRFSVYIYLFFLPFQIHQTLGYLSIVGVAVASTIFLGFMELGNQLEEPFNYDDSDLDLDLFCELISSELKEIVAHPCPDFSFVLSEENQPFGPSDTRITLQSRNLATLVWIHAPSTTVNVAALKDLSPAQLELEELKGLVEKRTVLNLVEAFSVATKHYLRGEHGPYWEDLFPLVSGLPKYAFRSSDSGEDKSFVLGFWRHTAPDGNIYLPAEINPRTRTRTGSETTVFPTPLEGSFAASSSDLEKGGTSMSIDLEPAWNPPPRTIYDFVPPLLIFRPILALFTNWGDTSKKAQRRRLQEGGNFHAHLPLEILCFLSSYIHQLVKRGTLETSLYGSFLATTTSLQDCITVLERILTSPLPFAFSSHLRFSVYIYLVFLPFQVHAALGYLSIVGVAVASVMFLGFLELGDQLEVCISTLICRALLTRVFPFFQNPFGYDDSDLDLDRFSKLISAELREIATVSPDFSFVFSEDNRPFAPSDIRSAAQIVEERGPTGLYSFRRTLAKEFNDSLEFVDKVDRRMRMKVEVVSI
ncbi:ion channel-forming bestrophin family protein, partial [Phenoliferia sp. Uapishka_3]